MEGPAAGGGRQPRWGDGGGGGRQPRWGDGGGRAALALHPFLKIQSNGQGMLGCSGVGEVASIMRLRRLHMQQSTCYNTVHLVCYTAVGHREQSSFKIGF